MFLRIHIPLGRKADSFVKFVKFVVAFSSAEADSFGLFVVILGRRPTYSVNSVNSCSL